MDIRQLEYFLAVAEEGLITKAAQRLHITQSPLSQQMIALEKELGAQLFRRDKKQIVLTKAGLVLKHRAEQILGLAQDTRTEVHEAAHGLQGRLNIGTINSSGRTLLPEVIADFHESFPLISFDLRQGDTPHLLEELDAHLIDLAFVRLPVNEFLYEQITVPTERMVIAAAPGRFGLPEDNAPLAGLTSVPLLLHRRYQETVLAYFQSLALEPRIFCLSDELIPLLTWAMKGLGIAVVPEFAPQLFTGSALVIRTLSSPAVLNSSALIWLKNAPLPAAAANFIDFFQKKI